MAGRRHLAGTGRWLRGWRRVTAFHDVTVLLLRSRDRLAVATPIELRAVTASNVADALAMEDASRVEEFRGFLARGDAGIFGYREGRVVHRSWVRFGPFTASLWHGYGRHPIAADEGWIHYCETAPAARGLRAYPAALARILVDHAGRAPGGFWIGSRSDNPQSLRGIALAGFVPDRRVRIRVRFGLESQHEEGVVGAGASR